MITHVGLKNVGVFSVQGTVDDLSPSTLSDLSQIWQGPITDLFKSIAVVRIFCHPEVRRTIKAVLDTDKIIAIALEELEKL